MICLQNSGIYAILSIFFLISKLFLPQGFLDPKYFLESKKKKATFVPLDLQLFIVQEIFLKLSFLWMMTGNVFWEEKKLPAERKCFVEKCYDDN